MVCQRCRAREANSGGVGQQGQPPHLTKLREIGWQDCIITSPSYTLLTFEGPGAVFQSRKVNQLASSITCKRELFNYLQVLAEIHALGTKLAHHNNDGTNTKGTTMFDSCEMFRSLSTIIIHKCSTVMVFCI